MRVLHLIDSAGVYGAETLLLALVAAQRADGIDAEIGSMAGEGESERPLEKECARRGLPYRCIRFSPALNLFAAGRVLKEAEARGVGLLHTHGYKPDILFGMLLRLVRHIPVISTVHGWTETRRFSKMGLYQAVQKKSWRWIERVVAVADDSPAYRWNDPIHRTVTIDTGIVTSFGETQQPDPSIVARIENHRRGRPCIGMVGRLSPEKGADILLSALKILKSRGMAPALVMIGEGPEQKIIERLIERHELQDQVLMLGYVQNAGSLMSCFDMLAMPSRTEGLPMTLLEAMAHTVPVIASRVGQIPIVLEQGACGVLVDAEDAGALAEGVSRLLSDRDYRDAMKTRAKARVVSEYGMSRTAEEYAALYKSLVTIKQSGG